MARSITTRSTNPKIMDDNIKILDDALGGVSAPEASDVSYDNTDSGLTADDVQGAIDEINTVLGSHVTLLGNTAVTAGTWDTATLSEDINNYRYLAFNLGISDNAPDQSAFNLIIPTSAFKLSTTSSPVAVVHDYLTASDSKSCLAAYATDTTISIYKGSDLGSFRISVIGIM